MKKIIGIVLLCVSIFIGAVRLHADDTELFITQLPPDALILLDMSGSMNYSPAGPPYVSAPNRRIDIARAVIMDFLDDNDDGLLDAKDEKSLNIRLGYMRFWSSITMTTTNRPAEPSRFYLILAVLTVTSGTRLTTRRRRARSGGPPWLLPWRRR